MQGKNFFFAIDFLKENALLLEEQEIEPAGLYLDCKLYSNWPVATAAPSGVPFRAARQSASDLLRMQNCIEQLQDKQRAGFSYLANLCFRFELELADDFLSFLPYVQAPYRLYWKDHFLCFSPEGFIHVHAGRICTYPMKGTLAADRPLSELLEDPKETAEHFTVVDLLRNDLGRVARHVTVERFRYVEKIDHREGQLYQTSSEISGLLQPGFENRFGSLLDQLLPAGSVTGAPKKETVEILTDLEDTPRGFFCGVAGFVRGDELVSFVLIRFVDLKDRSYRCGAGITVYSDPLRECREILDKIYVPSS